MPFARRIDRSSRPSVALLLISLVALFAAAPGDALLVASAPAGASAAPVPASLSTSMPTWRVAWGTALHSTVADSAWNAHPTPRGPTASDATYRFVAVPSIGGDRVRIRLANWVDRGLRFSGLQPVTFDSVTVSVRSGSGGSTAQPGTMRRVTFGGRGSLTLLPDATRLSDPVDLRVGERAVLLVSVHTTTPNLAPPAHAQTFVTQYATSPGAGDHTEDVSGAAFVRRQEPIYWLDAIEVRTLSQNSIVAIGDSITDGDHCGTPRPDGSCGYNDDAFMDRVTTYPGFLVERLRAHSRYPATGVVNKGSNGAISLQTLLVLGDDVLRQAGVTAAIVEIGTNDLTIGVPEAVVRANLASMARRLRRHDITPIGATLVPRRDMKGASARADAARARLNDWIRHSGVFDVVLDIAAVVGTGPDDNRYRPEYDSGDHLHPNAAGQRAIAHSLSLRFLRR